MMSPQDMWVDRDDELTLMRNVATSGDPSRILLLQAKSGMGKTWLLEEFIRRNSSLLIATVDFKPGDLSLADVFNLIIDCVGAQRFSHFDAAVRGVTGAPDVKVDRNLVFARSSITVALAAPDEEARSQRRSLLTRAFIDDLRDCDRLVLLFDTYEKSQAVGAWLANALGYFDRSPNLSVIVAGQSVPAPPTGCHHRLHELRGINAYHWHAYAVNRGINKSLDFFDGVCSYCQGHPLQMLTFLDSLTGSRS